MRSIVMILAATVGLAAAAAAQAPGFDGTYRGEVTSGTGCTPFRPTLRVANGVATFRYNPQTTFEGTVGPNGSLNASYGPASLSGKFADGKFQGTVSSGRCQYALDLSK
jgi:hypothetical protein